ncbi:MAG: methylated-DNA--[protein]-cysteine S-methyltransferase [Thermoanaerobaculia bacterium]
MTPIRYCHLPTAIGTLLLATSEKGVVRIEFEKGRRSEPDPEWRHDPAALEKTATELTEYLSGKRRSFTVPLDPDGTPFQLDVWNALRRIPYGETRTYGWIAQEIGRPAASRAVGAANGANPIPIIVPCHRVIGSTGALTGFGGGIAIKRWLLDLESGRRLLGS